MIKLFNANRDEVIKSSVAQAAVRYGYALEKIFPLIDKFEEQRKLQRRKFYDRLKADIVRGCQMPAITLAFVDPTVAGELDLKVLAKYVEDRIGDGYVLDGMQRMATLSDASSEEGFDANRELQVNVIIAERYDLLLYRMITLNNGQKPMTARHQIEMLTKGMLTTDALGIDVVSEKETERTKAHGAFKRSDIAEAYTAFLTNSVHNQNARIIESKLDEILVGKVMDSNITESDLSFQDVLGLVERFSHSGSAKDWLRLGNNLIGFSVGAKKSYQALFEMSAAEFSAAIEVFESAFDAMDASKINVGRYRRELSRLFVGGIAKYGNADVESLIDAFHQATLAD